MMPANVKKEILAIPGSTRQHSTNHRLIKAITALLPGDFTVTIYDEIGGLPHFNPDNNNDHVAREVADFRALLHRSAGVIICTPEYAHGVPGTLKNAIDWTVSSGEFSQKPTVLITASTDGTYGHQALLETLRVIEAKNIDQLQLLVQFAQTKINNDHIITDQNTLTAIKEIIRRFHKTINEAAASKEI